MVHRPPERDTFTDGVLCAMPAFALLEIYWSRSLCKREKTQPQLMRNHISDLTVIYTRILAFCVIYIPL